MPYWPIHKKTSLWQYLAMQRCFTVTLSWPPQSCWTENSWVRGAVFIFNSSQWEQKEKIELLFGRILSPLASHGMECHSLTTQHMNDHLLFWFWGKNLLISCDVSYFLYWKKLQPIPLHPDTSDFPALVCFCFSLYRRRLMTLIISFSVLMMQVCYSFMQCCSLICCLCLS